MEISRKDVEHVARLARLELNQAEQDHMATQLSEILTYVEQLQALDTDAVEPMAQVMTDARPEASLRDDIARPSLPREQAVRSAPDADEAYVRVPKVIER